MKMIVTGLHLQSGKAFEVGPDCHRIEHDDETGGFTVIFSEGEGYAYIGRVLREDVEMIVETGGLDYGYDMQGEV